MLFKKALSLRIEELCANKNITINRLAETSTIPPSTLRDIVNCKVENPSSTVIYQLCKTLKISLKEFFDSKLFEDIDD
ncbi:MAG: helix-turn-helix domain-containing protein [Candidatus Coprovivens sp.]